MPLPYGLRQMSMVLFTYSTPNRHRPKNQMSRKRQKAKRGINLQQYAMSRRSVHYHAPCVGRLSWLSISGAAMRGSTYSHCRLECNRSKYFARSRAAANQQPANKQLSTTGSTAKQATSAAARRFILRWLHGPVLPAKPTARAAASRTGRSEEPRGIQGRGDVLLAAA